MSRGCRDCSECTEASATGCVMFAFRFLWIAWFGWNIGLFIKRCPQCGHWMSRHSRRADGSFRD